VASFSHGQGWGEGQPRISPCLIGFCAARFYFVFLKYFWKKIFFYFFNIFILFWYINIKNNFLKIKKYFNIFLNKNIFKNNDYCIFKTPRYKWWSMVTQWKGWLKARFINMSKIICRRCDFKLFFKVRKIICFFSLLRPKAYICIRVCRYIVFVLYKKIIKHSFYFQDYIQRFLLVHWKSTKRK